jgi:hypothetical protein
LVFQCTGTGNRRQGGTGISTQNRIVSQTLCQYGLYVLGIGSFKHEVSRLTGTIT